MAKSVRKPRWQASTVIGEYRAYARNSRQEIIVRIEKVGDDTKYAEWGMPKYMGLNSAMSQAVTQTRPEDIKE